MRIQLLFLIVMAGFLMSYFTNLRFLKNLRENKLNFKKHELILANIFFGGPVLLLFYIFDDFRANDESENRIFLVSGIILSVLQIGLIVTLFVLKLIILA